MPLPGRAPCVSKRGTPVGSKETVITFSAPFWTTRDGEHKSSGGPRKSGTAAGNERGVPVFPIPFTLQPHKLRETTSPDLVSVFLFCTVKGLQAWPLDAFREPTDQYPGQDF